MSKREPQGEGRRGDDSAPGLGRLPPGRHGLSRDFVARNQRDRLTAGIIAAVAEHGYHDATISQISAAAGVSRRTFYAYYSGKQESFLAAYDLILAYLRDAARAAAGDRDWPDRVRAKLAAMLDVLAANPDLVRFVLIAPPRAGAELAARYRRALDEGLAELIEGMPPPPTTRRPSEAAEHALLGGAVAMVAQKVEAGEGKGLPELLPELLELVLAPYLGREAAVAVARQAG